MKLPNYERLRSIRLPLKDSVVSGFLLVGIAFGKIEPVFAISLFSIIFTISYYYKQDTTQNNDTKI